MGNRSCNCNRYEHCSSHSERLLICHFFSPTVAVVSLLVGAAVFSYKRNQRRKREQAVAEATAAALEAGRARSYEKKSSRRTSKRESNFDSGSGSRGTGSRSTENVTKVCCRQSPCRDELLISCILASSCCFGVK